MKRVLSLVLTILLTFAVCATALAEGKLAWYFPAPHPYGEEVKSYAEQYAADNGKDVKIMFGSDFEQATQDANIQALVADGYNYISVFPNSDAAAGLFEELDSFGVKIVTFGGATGGQTEQFCVATDTEAAAYAACEYVIEAMGGQGGILNVLETLTDTNTQKRKAGVEACIADHEGVELVQQVADITNIDTGVEKISSALTANIDKVNGIVCTGNTTSSAAVQVLDDYYQRNPDADKIYLICIDTPDDVMQGIDQGIVYGTIAQNTAAHGYIPLVILDLMSEGYEKVEGNFFIDSGCVLVTKDNLNSFSEDLSKVTDQIIEDLTGKYLTK